MWYSGIGLGVVEGCFGFGCGVFLSNKYLWLKNAHRKVDFYEYTRPHFETNIYIINR